MDLSPPQLIVLVGPAGAGKSSAARSFPATWRLELDAFRQTVADDAGNQDVTPDAVTVFSQALDARLARQLSTVVDATSIEPHVRTDLIERAHAHDMNAVAIVLRTPLSTCQARQHARPTNRQVPADIIAEQHHAAPSLQQLQAEGFDYVHDAADVDLLGMLLRRSAAAEPDPLAEVRAVFGEDLAAVFTAQPGSDRGAFAVGGRQVVVRHWVDGDPGDAHWQALTRCPEDPPCPGPAWVQVTGASQLLDVYEGRDPEEVHCVCSDDPLAVQL